MYFFHHQCVDFFIYLIIKPYDREKYRNSKVKVNIVNIDYIHFYLTISVNYINKRKQSRSCYNVVNEKPQSLWMIVGLNFKKKSRNRTFLHRSPVRVPSKLFHSPPFSALHLFCSSILSITFHSHSHAASSNLGLSVLPRDRSLNLEVEGNLLNPLTYSCPG